MIHFGETIPDGLSNVYHISAGVLGLWAVMIYILMLATFGIGAATGPYLFHIASYWEPPCTCVICEDISDSTKFMTIFAQDRRKQ